VGTPGGDGLGRRAAQGAAWSYGSYVLNKAVSLAVTAVLARLLLPAEFGVVALALVVIAFLETLADLGLNQSIVIASDDEVQDRADTVLLAVLGLALLLAALSCAVAPLLAAFFEEPALTAILPVMAATFVVRAVGGTPYALAQRRMDFRTRTAAELSDVAVRGALSIALAVGGAGAWSLVLGSLAGAAARTSLLWLKVRWTPSWRLRTAQVRPMLRFGGAVTGVSLLSAVIANVDYVAVSRELGTTALGYYTIAFRLPELLILNLSLVATGVLFPAFSTTRPEDLGRRLLVSLHYTAVVCVPLAVLLWVLADPLTAVLFGPAWAPAVPVMQVLSLYALATAVTVPWGSMYKAIGRADLLLKLAVPRTLLAVALVLLAAPHGLVAVGAAQATAASVFAVLGTLLALRHTGTAAARLWRALAAPVAGGATAGAAAVAAAAVLPSPGLTLIVGGTCGACAYAAALLLLAPTSVRQVRDWVRRSQPSPAGAP
jgi:lipopolysaccharide exporter